MNRKPAAAPSGLPLDAFKDVRKICLNREPKYLSGIEQ